MIGGSRDDGEAVSGSLASREMEAGGVDRGLLADELVEAPDGEDWVPLSTVRVNFGNAARIAQTGWDSAYFFLKYRTCSAVRVPTAWAISLFCFSPKRRTAERNDVTSASVHGGALFVDGRDGCEARCAETWAWWNALSWFRRPCTDGNALSQKLHCAGPSDSDVGVLSAAEALRLCER